MQFDIYNFKTNKKKFIKEFENNFIDYKNIYFDKSYISLFSNDKKSEILFFIFKEEKNKWGYVFTKSMVSKKYLPIKKNYYDIESPYGFYGPVSNSKNIIFLKKANQFFQNWCYENNIIAEFIRFNPITDNHNYRIGVNKILERRNLIYKFNFSKNFENIFKSKIMNQINNHTKYKIDILDSSSLNDYNDFIKIYLAHMKTINANSFYYFSNEFFSQLYKLLKSNGFLVICKDKNKVLGGAITLFDNNNAYYFLSALKKNIFISGLSNAMIFYSLKKIYKLKKKIYFLGGGNSSTIEDNLFKFKKKMSNTECDYYIGKKIYYFNEYNQTVENWKKQNLTISNKYSKYLLKYKFN